MPNKLTLPQFQAEYAAVINIGLVTFYVTHDHLIKISGPGDPPPGINGFRRKLESASALVKIGVEDPAVRTKVFELATEVVKTAVAELPKSASVAA